MMINYSHYSFVLSKLQFSMVVYTGTVYIEKILISRFDKISF